MLLSIYSKSFNDKVDITVTVDAEVKFLVHAFITEMKGMLL